MSLDECISKHSHRQYRAWMAWLSLDRSRPSKSDWYIMQVTQHLYRLLNKSEPDLQEFVLKPKDIAEDRPVTKKENTSRSKSFWFALSGISRNKKK